MYVDLVSLTKGSRHEASKKIPLSSSSQTENLVILLFSQSNLHWRVFTRSGTPKQRLQNAL